MNFIIFNNIMSRYLREKVLVTVGKLGSIGEAANELAISQPSVSTILKKLENEVGGPVFYHGERPILLTPLGKLLATQYEKILELDRQTQGLVASFNQGIYPELRIGVVSSFFSNINPYYLPELLTQAERISTREGDSGKIAELLLANQLDFAIINTNFPNESDIITHKLLTENYLLALPNKLYKRGNNHISDYFDLLQNIPVVFSGSKSYDNLSARRILNSLGVHLKKVMEIECYSTICQLVSSGACWSLLTPFTLQIGKDFSSHIKLIPIDLAIAKRSFYLCYKPWMNQLFEKRLFDLLANAILNRFLVSLQKQSPELISYIHIEDILVKRAM